MVSVTKKISNPFRGIAPLKWMEYKSFLLFFLPSLMIVFAFTLLPLFENLRMSFFGEEGFTPEYYEALFSSKYFWNDLRITIIWVIITVALTLLSGLAGALLFNREYKGKGVVSLVLLLPFITPEWVSALVWQWMYHSEFGITNEILRSLGVISQNVAWLSRPEIVIYAIAVSYIWRVGAYMMIVFIAGLQLIGRPLYEAAKVDGASVWQRFRHITLPQLVPTILTVLTILTLWSFQCFTRIYIMTRGGPARASEVLSVIVYNESFCFLRFNVGAAAANVLFALVVILIFVYLRLGGRSRA